MIADAATSGSGTTGTTQSQTVRARSAQRVAYAIVVYPALGPKPWPVT